MPGKFDGAYVIKDKRANDNIHGLQMFNSFVSSNIHGCDGYICEARKKSIIDMSNSGNGADLEALLEVFKYRWPHWFNGNLHQKDIDPNKVQAECLRILQNLKYHGEADGITPATSLSALSGFGLARTSKGRRGVSAVPRNDCENHPGKPASVYGKICSACQQRKYKFRDSEYAWVLQDENLLDQLLAIPVGRGRGTYMVQAIEIIEAKYLFDLDPSQIEVLVHPECIVHGIVHFKDGSSIAHMGFPDMRIPISYALYYPEVKENNLPRFNLKGESLSFFEPDHDKFPSIKFAYSALKNRNATGLRKANDFAVEKFLKGEIEFEEIFQIIQKQAS